ncbi:arylsulfatase [Abditibacteriota bacterium]|nr:arylsulfatase [Abditibacteriota bacterium]
MPTLFLPLPDSVAQKPEMKKRTAQFSLTKPPSCPLRLLFTAAMAFGPLVGCHAAPTTGKAAPPKTATAPATPAHPNIIFVLADDMGYGDLGCYGGQGVKTPNVDRLAAEGIRFTQFYVNSPLCSPSRTAFTTGQYPARWKITSYIDNRGLNQSRGMAQWLDVKAPTVARSLASAGYMTGHFGKWHMGGGRDVGEAPLITEYGFAQSLTQFEGLGDRVLPVMSAQNGRPEYKLPLGVASEKLGRGKVTWAPRSQITTAFVNRALSFINEAQKNRKPFFIDLWPDDVHSPYDPPEQLRGNGAKRQLYRGVVTNMDTELAPLFAAIRNNPRLRGNTLVIFASDNGPEGGAGLAGPFRGGKGELYEGGIREPFILWGPGILPAKQQGTVNTTAVVSGVDFLPSILKIAGVKDIPKGDGTDLSATFTGKATTGRTQPLFWKRPPDREGNGDQPLPDLAVRDGNWKLLVQEDGTQPHLYNLATDEGETKDLATAQLQIVQRLTKAVLDWNHTLPVVKLAVVGGFNDATHFDLKKGDHLGRNQAPNVAKRGFTITTKFNAATPGGVLVAQGGVAQGYTLFFDKAGKLNFLERAGGVATTITSPDPVTGSHTVIARLGADRSLTLTIDGKVVAQGQATALIASQPVDGLDVGADTAGAVGPYDTPNPFNGDIESATIDLEAPLD